MNFAKSLNNINLRIKFNKLTFLTSVLALFFKVFFRSFSLSIYWIKYGPEWCSVEKNKTDKFFTSETICGFCLYKQISFLEVYELYYYNIII